MMFLVLPQMSLNQPETKLFKLEIELTLITVSHSINQSIQQSINHQPINHS